MISRVAFYSEGKKLSGNLHLPYEKAPCIICLHGLEGSKDDRKWKVFTSRSYDEGYACLSFSFRGCGEGLERSKGEFEDVSLTARIEDYKSALAFLEGAGRVDMGRLGVVGSSFGGMVAIASGEAKVKAMVTLAAPYKIPRFDRPLIPKEDGDYYVLPSGRRFKKSFYEDMRRYNLLRDVKEAPPILIIHGDSDEIVPLEHAHRLYEAAPEPKRLEVIQGADHIFSNLEHLNRVVDLSLAWFKEHL